MTRMMRAQRGSLLSSIVMVMLATVATALLAFIGFQALPESVVPATFGGEDRSSREVDVSESPYAPTSTPTGKPTVVAPPSTHPPFPSETANPNASNRTRRPGLSRSADPGRGTTAPKPTAGQPAPAPKPTTTTTAPKPTPSTSAPRPSPSPSPSCTRGNGNGKCRTAGPSGTTASPRTTSSYSGSSYGDSAYDAPTKSSTSAKASAKASAKSSAKSSAKKSAPKKKARRTR